MKDMTYNQQEDKIPEVQWRSWLQGQYAKDMVGEIGNLKYQYSAMAKDGISAETTHSASRV